MTPQIGHLSTQLASTPLPGDDQAFSLSRLSNAITSGVIILAVAVVVVVVVAVFLTERQRTGRPSFVTWAAAHEARSLGRPLWEPLALHVVLAGLFVALVGWRATSVDGPLQVAGVTVTGIGLVVAVVGGVISGALAHPPRTVEGHAPPEIAHPTPAHRIVTRWGRLGAGPVGAPLIVGGGILAVVSTPVAAVTRALVSADDWNTLPAHVITVSGVAAMCLGAWMLHAEGRHAARRGRPARGQAGRRGRVGLGRLDVAECFAAAAVLVAASVALDGGLPASIGASVGLAVLVVVRVRATVGSALTTAGVYLAVRAACALLTMTPQGPLAPFAWQIVVAALAVEIVLLPLRGTGGTASSADAAVVVVAVDDSDDSWQV